VNNWDLVDAGAPEIVGGYLLERERARLDRLADSAWLWDRRIAIVATHTFIRAGQSADTYRLALRLLADRHDLIHKAVGWMLREAGKRVDRAELLAFLDDHAAAMPPTMLRYAVEHLDPILRAHYRGLRRSR
jgi:3-methyladenine DNA glycosylase AlkD